MSKDVTEWSTSDLPAEAYHCPTRSRFLSNANREEFRQARSLLNSGDIEPKTDRNNSHLSHQLMPENSKSEIELTPQESLKERSKSVIRLWELIGREVTEIDSI